MTAKMKPLMIGVFIAVSLSSCYTTKVTVGNVSPHQPMTKINSEWNHHIIAGLIPVGKNKMRADNYVGDRTRYMIKTNQSFLNLLVGFLTGGIYTPTTTSYYAPLDAYDYDNSKPAETKMIHEYINQRNIHKGKTQDRTVIIHAEPSVEQSSESEKTEVRSQGVNNNARRTVVDSTPDKPTQKRNKDGYRATVYFRNGAKMDGTVYGGLYDGRITIKMVDGTVVESKSTEINRIERK